MENMFTNDMTNNWLISKISNKLIQLNIKKEKKIQLKMVRGPEQTFSQRRHTDGN